MMTTSGSLRCARAGCVSFLELLLIGQTGGQYLLAHRANKVNANRSARVAERIDPRRAATPTSWRPA
jgi:hypothetical protein